MIDEEVFKPIPGYEGIYSISSYGQIKQVKFNRFKNTTITKRGQEVVVLFRQGLPTTYTVSSLIKWAWKGIPPRKHPSIEQRCKRIKCEETNQIFNSYKECAQELGLDYKKMCTSISKSGRYKGYHFIRID